MKRMKKSRGVAVLVILVLILGALGAYAGIILSSTGAGKNRNIKLGLDLAGGVSITYEAVGDTPTSEEMNDTIYKLQQRIENDLGSESTTTEANVYQVGDDRITVEIPGVTDANAILEELGTPGALYFIKQKNAEGNENYSYDTASGTFTLNYDLSELEENGSIVLTGSEVESAEATYETDQTTKNQKPVVQINLNETGTQAFADATTSAYQNGESIGIYYDGRFVSVPNVNSAITDGNCVIEGMDDYEEAESLASYIRIGGLDVELAELQSEVVGAQLGSDALKTSLMAGAIGLGIVIVFLIAMYLLPGFAAALALLLYTELIISILYLFDITLTLPGIAGIILSIGMAVDGNVIINTRIKEELNAGQPVDQAIRLGFKKSMSAILDGNITTLIVAVVLLIFGSGTVKGFGYTLAFGIVLSVFTSLVVSRLIVNGFYGVGLKGEGCYAKVSKKARKIFDFVGKKAVFIIIACVCILAGVVSMIANGASGKGALNYSIEFIGGVSTTVDMQKDVSIDDFNGQIKSDIESVIGSSDIEGQKVTGTTQYVIKTPELSQDQISQLKTLLVDKYGADAESFEIEKITATVSRELQRDAFISLAIATACMLIYIWIRFRKFKVAASSVIALIHDVCIVVAFYALFRLSVGNSFIACILSIVGYSINATIIVFDRVRENLTNPLCSYDLKKTINLSINQTLTRTLFTSLTTFIVVLFLYILGVESMRAFALPLAVGIIAGTYSSVLISGNLLYIFTPKAERYDDTAARSASKLMAKQSASDAAAAAVSGIAAVNETAGQEVKPAKITANPNRKKKKKRKQ